MYAITRNGKVVAKNLATQQQAHDVAVNWLGLEERHLDAQLVWEDDAGNTFRVVEPGCTCEDA